MSPHNNLWFSFVWSGQQTSPPKATESKQRSSEEDGEHPPSYGPGPDRDAALQLDVLARELPDEILSLSLFILASTSHGCGQCRFAKSSRDLACVFFFLIMILG